MTAPGRHVTSGKSSASRRASNTPVELKGLGGVDASDRARTAYAAVRDLVTKREPVDVIATLHDYEDMVIESFEVPRNGRLGEVVRFTPVLKHGTKVAIEDLKPPTSTVDRGKAKVNRRKTASEAHRGHQIHGAEAGEGPPEGSREPLTAFGADARWCRDRRQDATVNTMTRSRQRKAPPERGKRAAPAVAPSLPDLAGGFVLDDTTPAFDASLRGDEILEVLFRRRQGQTMEQAREAIRRRRRREAERRKASRPTKRAGRKSR